MPDQATEFQELVKAVRGLQSRGLVILQQYVALWHCAGDGKAVVAYIRHDHGLRAVTLSHSPRGRPYLILPTKDLTTLKVGQTTNNFLQYQVSSAPSLSLFTRLWLATFSFIDHQHLPSEFSFTIHCGVADHDFCCPSKEICPMLVAGLQSLMPVSNDPFEVFLKVRPPAAFRFGYSGREGGVVCLFCCQICRECGRYFPE